MISLKSNGQRSVHIPVLLNPFAGAIASVAGPRKERQTVYPLGTTVVTFKRGMKVDFNLPRRL